MYVDAKIEQYVAALIAATHREPRIERGVAPEKSAVVLDAAREVARTNRREWVTPHDVKLAVPALFREWITVAGTVLPTERDDVIATLLDLVAVP